jgi:hypothetical protein
VAYKRFLEFWVWIGVRVGKREFCGEFEIFEIFGLGGPNLDLGHGNLRREIIVQ